MSEGEDLADMIAVALRGSDQFGYTDVSDLSDAVLDSRYDLLAIADAVLVHYQRKPQTVSSAAELDALSVGSAVAVALHPQKWHHGVWVKTDTDEWSSHDWRAKRDNESMAVGPEGAITPATVLFTPDGRP